MQRKPRTISSFPTIITFVCLSIIGAALLPFLSVQLYPSTETPGLTVTYFWPDASAQIMEQEVTAKLEGRFSAVKGIENITSVSSKSHGRINITFKKDVNRDAMRFEIANLIRQCYPELPADVSYPQLSMGISGDRVAPVMSYSVNGSASPHFIRKYVEKEVIPPLTRIEGVNEVQLYGATPYGVEIEFNSEHIRSLNITADEITTAINRHFKTDRLGKGSYARAGKDNFEELSVQLRYNLSDTLVWEAIPVKKVGGRILYLKDLVRVRYKEQRPGSYFRINGLNTINLVIYPEKGVNTILLAKNIREEMKRIGQTLMPGYSILLANDSTEHLTKEINTILYRAALSLSILLAFVFIVTRQWRYLLLIVLTVVANLLVSSIFFYFFKVELQLYSLAGLTISLGIMIDSSIIMIDHIRQHKNRKAFLPIFAATSTTMAALAVVYFLPDEEKRNLIHFAAVIIVNLSVSVVVALFLIPALMAEVRLSAYAGRRLHRRRRLLVRFSGFYERCMRGGKRFKWIFIVIFILGFGIPVHWLPDKIEGERTWSGIYNASLGSEWFLQDIKPTLEKIVGGSLRLFVVNVFENSYYPEPGKTMLHVRASMPEGCTIEQMNETIAGMENFISRFEEVAMFQTTVPGYRNASIAIHFKPEHERTGFPHALKSQLELMAISLGGADWSVYGVGLGFSNAISGGYKSERIAVMGYNYEQLYEYAEFLKTRLEENLRVREVEISGSNGRNDRHEFFVSPDAGRLASEDVTLVDFYQSLADKSYRREVNPVYTGDELQRVYLISDSYGAFNAWDFSNTPLNNAHDLYKLGDLASIEKRKMGFDITKSDQQYHLVVAYDFLGPYQLAERVRKQHIEAMTNLLPLGYTVQADQFRWWHKENKKQYYFIFLVIGAIYFICAILLESLLQPLAIITMIPISFAGVFLTFYLFELNFDQGGYASFILLAGLSINAALYIINDYNNLVKRFGKTNVRRYVKAFNHKIIPIVLTILSTILGLLPFIIEGQRDVFWFAFASGAIGGLLFSMVGIFVYLPVLLRLKDR